MSTARDKVAEALYRSHCRPDDPTVWNQTAEWVRESWRRQADAAITVHLDALKADGCAVIRLPESTITEAFGSQCLQWLDGEVTFFPAEGRLEFDYRSIAPETARAVAAALIAGAAEAQR
jgi:hypothetical protein